MLSVEQARALVETYGTGVVIDALAPLLSPARRERIECVLSARLGGLSIALENLYDPHNGAAAIRTAEALGLTRVHVIEQAGPFRAAKAVTIGSHKWIDVEHHSTVDALAELAHARGITLCATTPDARQTIEDIDPARPSVLLFGNERDGLSERALALADCAIAIPMYGFSQSFNLSVSVALVAVRAAQRRRQAIGRVGDLPDDQCALLRARWYALGVRGAEQIVERTVSATTRVPRQV